MKMKSLLNYDLRLCINIMRNYYNLNSNELISRANDLLSHYTFMSNIGFVMNDLNRLHLIILKHVLKKRNIKLENTGIAGMGLRIKREL